MILTKYTPHVYQGKSGFYITFIRLSDGLLKTFFQTGQLNELGKSQIYSFCSSMTDELMDGYFPRQGKKDVGMYNFLFMGDDPDYKKATELSESKYIEYKSHLPLDKVFC